MIMIETVCKDNSHWWEVPHGENPTDEQYCLCGKVKWIERNEIEIPAERLEILYS